MGKMQKKLKQVTILLAMLLLLVVAFALPSFAQEANTITNGNVTDGNITDGNVTDGNVTGGDADEPVVLQTMGDLNNDGDITAGEARTVLRAAVGLDQLAADIIAYADMNYDGALNAGDARSVLRISVNLDTKVQHSFVLGEAVAATCSAEGSASYSCAHCELENTITFAKLAHAFVSVSKTEATCTTAGADYQKCSACGEERAGFIAAKGHDFKETSRTEPTCTAKGLITYTCSVCSATQTEEIKSKGHSYKETKNEPDTCTTAGVKEYTCSVCSYVMKLPGKVLGHNMVRCTATTPQHCDRCNEKYAGVQQAASGLWYCFEKSGNNYTPAKNKIVGSAYYGPDGARVDDASIEAAVEFVNTYTNPNDSAYNRFSDCYYIMVDYFTYGNNPDVTQTPDGRHIPGYATEMFSKWTGNCYRFAAALAYCGRVLGFDVGFITGQISASGGGTTTHGLTTVKYNGTTYWCDAMMQNKYPNYNSFMVTKNSYPYGYTANYSINMTVANGKVTWK